MKKIIIPQEYNYIGAFLTFVCNLRCSYCINNENNITPKSKMLSVDQWVKGLNNISTRPDLPITLQGGEPTLYPGFYDVVNGIDKDINIDILTNGQFDVDEFMKRIPPERMKRESKYASIRFSYHMETMPLTTLVTKVQVMKAAGYSVGVWIVDHPRDSRLIHAAANMLVGDGIDCRLKEFLGVYKGKRYGTYRYPEAIDGKWKACLCKPSEMLIDPSGAIHRCHYELYSNAKPYAHLLDKTAGLLNAFKECKTCGMCNSCDIKLKTDRFQEDGHCSVEVRDGVVLDT